MYGGTLALESCRAKAASHQDDPLLRENRASIAAGGRHRLYQDDFFKRLTFIRRSRHLALPSTRSATCLAWSKATDTCEEVKGAGLAHLKDIRRKIADLRWMERTSGR